MSERINGKPVTIFKDAKTCGYVGQVYLGVKPDGKPNRPKRRGKTITEVRDKITKLLEELAEGVKVEAGYTVARCVEDFIKAEKKAGKAPGTIKVYTSYADVHVSRIGAVKIKDLTCDQVDEWLEKVAQGLSSETVVKVHGLLTRSIRRAMKYSKVGRNVSALVDPPQGGKTRGRRKSFSTDQTAAILREARDGEHRLSAYVIIGITAGLRPEELRSICWSDVDLVKGEIYVVRSVRVEGEVKTEDSRRGIAMAPIGMAALKSHKVQQAKELLALGIAQDDNTLIFTRPDGSAYTASSALWFFRKLLRAVEGIKPEEWVPYCMRHAFCSILSANDRPTREIADLMGHKRTQTTETVYRHDLKPVMNGASEIMGAVFNVA
jgi:integrase